MLVTLRTFGAVVGVFEVEEPSDLRLSEPWLEGVELCSLPLVCDGV